MSFLALLTVHRGIPGADLGVGVQGVRPPPLPAPWDEAFFFVFPFKIWLPLRPVTPFLRSAPLLRTILDPPLHTRLSRTDLTTICRSLVQLRQYKSAKRVFTAYHSQLVHCTSVSTDISSKVTTHIRVITHQQETQPVTCWRQIPKCRDCTAEIATVSF